MNQPATTTVNPAQTEQPLFSVIVPVFNRPQEVEELLDSLCRQDFRNFEVIIVEDGSTVTCEDICRRYTGTPTIPSLDLHYFFKPNSGPGPSRNFGAQHARGTYLLILDSDVVLPDTYLCNIAHELLLTNADAFGGPDRANDNFTPVQKAISYAMTSFFTTGGIRGGKKKLDKFYPRSFNLGIRRTVFADLGGFSDMRFGEDIDLSIRIYQGGYHCMLFPDAWVWHKRRATFRQFFKQVHNSGIARIVLYRKYPQSLKLVHLLPTLFTIGVAALLVAAVCGLCLHNLLLTVIPVALLAAYCLLLFIDSAIQNRSLYVGLLSVIAAFVQLIGYGTGFLRAVWHCLVCHETDFQAFRRNFYK